MSGRGIKKRRGILLFTGWPHGSYGHLFLQANVGYLVRVEEGSGIAEFLVVRGVATRLIGPYCSLD